ncbi:MAG: PHA/PHB synthase family protein [Alphaproteobacteria bacterium]
MTQSTFNPDIKIPDPLEMSKSWTRIAERAHKLVTDFAIKQNDPMSGLGINPLQITGAFMELTARMLADPTSLVKANMMLWQDYWDLWQHTTRKFLGEQTEPVVTTSDDKRFKDAAWDESALFDYIKQSYLLTARWIQGVVRNVEGLDDQTARKVDFYTRQFVDAMAPSNFVMTNPEVLRTTMETGGENLVKGLENLLSDLERGKGKLLIRMSDPEAFKVGENIATTAGKVVYQNSLMQLIQYSPTTEQTFTKPLLIVPPWINKYYILDMRQKNSFVKWAVDQGHTVFIISWVNPDGELADKSFEDYMNQGILESLTQIEKATGEKQVNAIGYCLGGTLLASTLAVLATKKDDRISSATYFVTLVDFTEVGEVRVFIDEAQLAALDEQMKAQGYLDAQSMHTAFNLLRANDLIWSFVVNNYLLGKEPFPFDLLYWNSDSTRMPAAMHSFYLHKMYQENLLVKPGAITLNNVGIDLKKIKTPSYIMGAREDHIAPWKSVYSSTQVYQGSIRFVLAASGHIAGVINPPAANKYSFWTNNEMPVDADQWFDTATQTEGSWWPDWNNWVAQYAGEKVPARVPGTGKLKALEDAPGSYVKIRAM